MKTRIKRTLAAIAALAALALGGSALAQAGGSGASTGAAVENSAGDTDNVQEGDQSGPEAADTGTEKEAGSESDSGPDTDNVQEGDQSGSDEAESPDSEAGSEVPGDDGPGGHADEAAK